jgi:MtN3 and saliva related transmembrane protein
MLSRIVAVLAPIVTSVQHLPQLYKIHKSKKVKHISFLGILLILLTESLWLLHGIFIMDKAVIVSSAFCVIINIIILFFYLIYS